jgi:thiamine-monophosphate kinase
MPKRRRPGLGEFELIAVLERELTRKHARAVEVGIGDDAAVVRFGRQRLVLTVDDQVEGAHFDLRWLSLADVGFRALQAATSDLAAMAAEPVAALASLHVPRDFPAARLRELARGQARASAELGCPVVGGNVTRGPVLSISTSVLGRAVARPLLRSGAKPGDELWLLGQLGLARAGLLLHQERVQLPRRLRAVATLAKRAWARPRALVAAGRSLSGRAHAAIDVSDGLRGDAGHLARASAVKVVLESRRISRSMSPELAELADLLGEPAVALALQGGEDYALLAAGPRARRPARAKVIGRIERGHGAELELETGQRFALGPGFDHLRR